MANSNNTKKALYTYDHAGYTITFYSDGTAATDSAVIRLSSPQSNNEFEICVSATAKEETMAKRKEIVFVDPTIADIETFLASVRPGVDAIVLDPARSAPAQIAAALKGRASLSSVHIVAHGSAGELS